MANVYGFSATGQVNRRVMDREAIINSISGDVYANPRRYGFEDPDDAADALIQYRDRIGSLIDRCIENNIPCDRFMERGLMYFARTMKRNRVRVQEREIVCECPDLWYGSRKVTAFNGTSTCSSDTASFKALPASETLAACNSAKDQFPVMPRSSGFTPVHSAKNEYCWGLTIFRSLDKSMRRMIFLFVKCALFVDDSTLAAAARYTELPEEWLVELISHAVSRMEHERTRLASMTEIRNTTWSRLYSIQARLAQETDPKRRDELRSALARYRQRYESIGNRISRMNVMVPNSIIAELLDVPKGTVDSGIYYLRQKHTLPGHEKNR